MATITFDTHRFVQKLKASGLEEKQAEAITEAFSEFHEETELRYLKDVATKGDIGELRLEMKGLEVKIAETKSELIRWVVGAGFLQTALITALLLRLIK